MKFSKPAAFAGVLGTTYAIGQESSSLTSTETEIMGYLFNMASEFDLSA